MPAGRFTTWGGQLGAFTPAARAIGGTAAGSTGSATGGGGKISINPIATPYDKILAQARANLQTPEQGASIANQQVSAQINAALGASNASSKLEQQQFADLQNRAMGFASGLGDLLTREAPSVGQAYQSAANALGSYGTGLTGAVAADQQAVADKARAQVAGLIGDQNAGLVGGYDIPGLRSTAQYTGVTLPASDLGAQAATAVRLQNAAATQGYGEVAQTARDYAQQAIDALNQRAAERAKIIAQRPELYQTALQAQRDDRNTTLNRIADLTSNQASWLQNRAQQAESARQFNVGQRETRREFGISEADKRRDAKTQADQWAQEFGLKQSQQDITSQYLYNTMRQTGASITGYDPVTNEPTWNTVQGNRQWQQNKASMANAFSTQNGYKTDWRGNPIPGKDGKLQPILGAKLNKAGTGVIKTYAPSSTTATGAGGLSAASVKDLVGTVNSQLDKGLSPKADIKTYAPNDPNADTNGYVHSRGKQVQYNDALNQAVSTFVASGMPAKNALARALVLVNAKYSTEGKLGRPYATATGRKEVLRRARIALKNDVPIQQLTPYLEQLGLFPNNNIKDIVQRVYRAGKYFPSGAFKTFPSWAQPSGS